MIWCKLRQHARRFGSDEGGIASVEAVLMLPLLAWAYVAGFIFFDAFRSQTDGLRATYSIADAIARETEPINQKYIDTMKVMYDQLSKTPEKASLRYTIICWSKDKKAYTVAWSKVTRSHSDIAEHSNQTIGKAKDYLPEIPYGDQIILVETWTEYKPFFDVGISNHRFEEAVVMRPRFTNQVKWETASSWVCKG